MKRYFSLILCFVLLIPCLVVPASATTQGVIDAIDDLAAGLGTSQSDIVDWLAEIFDQIDITTQNVVDAVLDSRDLIEVYLKEMTDTLLVNISSYLKSIKDYFYVNMGQTQVNTLFIGSSGPTMGTKLVSSTSAFTQDLIYVYNQFVQVFYVGFKSVYDALIVDSTLSDAVEEQVNQDATEASEYLDIMDDVTKPDVGELEDLSDISGYVNAGDVSVLAACLSPFFQSVIFLPCIMLSLIFMLVAYVLYGKR